MKKRKVPMRKSIVSNQSFPKKKLLRIAKNKEGVISIDKTGKAPGKGAYIALNLTEVKKARSKKMIERIFKISVAESFYDELEAYVKHILARRELFKEDDE
ncbi:MAG: YlxR family protein [Streptococcaceae bacterium]|nr:YlxR family protein [Streptococcaceae bacterium]